MGMVIFHAHYLYVYVLAWEKVWFTDGFWSLLWYMVAVGFVTVAGLVSYLSCRSQSLSVILAKASRRALILGALALTISVATYTLIPEQRISWGILHFLTLATLLGVITLRLWYANILIGIGLIILPYLISPVWDSILLIPVGFPSRGYYSADYYPLIPWFGYYLIGQGIGYTLSRWSRLSYLDWRISHISLLLYLGRHALIVYILHVPILYVMMWVWIG